MIRWHPHLILGTHWRVYVTSGRHWARVRVVAVVGLRRVARFILLGVTLRDGRSHGGMVRSGVAVMGVGGVQGQRRWGGWGRWWSAWSWECRQ